MKKFVTMLGIATVGMLGTQGASANDNAQKIAVVKKFLNCNFQDVCTGDNGTKETKKFLSKSAITVLNNERKNAIFDDVDCEADIPRCYSGLWTVTNIDWDDSVVKRTMKMSVAKNGDVVAKFQLFQNAPIETAHFKLVKENGQWKIDNTTEAWSGRHTGWWR